MPQSLSDDPRQLPVDDIRTKQSTLPTASARQPLSTSPVIFNKDSAVAGQLTSLDGLEPIRSIIVRSFSPLISVYASDDTNGLVRRKGIYGGLCSLLKPFGERVHGQVTIRHSKGSSKSFDDFGIRFVPFPSPEDISFSNSSERFSSSSQSAKVEDNYTQSSGGTGGVGSLSSIEEILGLLVGGSGNLQAGVRDGLATEPDTEAAFSAVFLHFLKKLLSRGPSRPHETLARPIACLIAVSSQNPTPIETLRDLYNDTRQQSGQMHNWAGDELLRYYVLVHDDDHDDISKSMTLFNLMKRHFGLHCHLLRIRGRECNPLEPERASFPTCEWLTAEQELVSLGQKEQNSGIDVSHQFVFETDAAVIRTFVRELVTQSLIPFAEGRVAVWNDQVGSRKRGIGGRFMSLSKKWAGFSTTRSPVHNPVSESSSPKNLNKSFETLLATDTLEGMMCRLGDFAFVLRDWDLASSVFNLLRNGFFDDRAGSYFAWLSEMAAFGFLLTERGFDTTSNLESIDNMLDAASSTYYRSSNTLSATRCLTVATELYRVHGGWTTDAAAKWVTRLFDLGILDSLSQAVVAGRMTVVYASQPGHGQRGWGSRRRKSDLWEFLGLKNGIPLGLYHPARLRIENRFHDLPSSSMKTAWRNLGLDTGN